MFVLIAGKRFNYERFHLQIMLADTFKLVIKWDKITAKNANHAHGHGRMKIFRPFAKNLSLVKRYAQ
jgi:hypothetical protein